MSKENKIIEEMAKVTSEALMSELGIRLDDKFLLRLAKHFYNAGYSKQSEGEWIAIPKRGLNSKKSRRINYFTFTCPVCGRSNGKHKSDYCPGCGANLITKPKGGEVI